jgi:5-methylcytosine-specific restriction endonuclease McrA
MTQETKRCTGSDCQLVKPLTEFPRDSRRSDGRQSQCKSCMAKRDRHRSKHPTEFVDRGGRKPLHPVQNGKKVCTRCKAGKPIADFPTYTSSRCKKCVNELRQGNPERWRRSNMTAQSRLIRDAVGHKLCANCARDRHEREFRIDRKEPDGLHRHCNDCLALPKWVIHGAKHGPVRTPELKKRHEREKARERPDANDRSALRRAVKKGSDGHLVSRNAIILRDESICYLCGLAAELKEIEIDHKIPITSGGAHTPENLAVSHWWCNDSKTGKTEAEYRAWLLTHESIVSRRHRAGLPAGQIPTPELRERHALEAEGARLADQKRSNAYRIGARDRLRALLIERDGDRCYLCPRENLGDDLMVGLRTPPSKGGLRVPENQVIVCRPCRNRKGNKTVEEYAQYLVDHPVDGPQKPERLPRAPRFVVMASPHQNPLWPLVVVDLLGPSGNNIVSRHRDKDAAEHNGITNARGRSKKNGESPDIDLSDAPGLMARAVPATSVPKWAKWSSRPRSSPWLSLGVPVLVLAA